MTAGVSPPPPPRHLWVVNGATINTQITQPSQLETHWTLNGIFSWLNLTSLLSFLMCSCCCWSCSEHWPKKSALKTNGRIVILETQPHPKRWVCQLECLILPSCALFHFTEVNRHSPSQTSGCSVTCWIIPDIYTDGFLCASTLWVFSGEQFWLFAETD